MTSNTKQATGAEMRLAARQARLSRLIENMVYGDKVRDQVAAPDETAALAAVDSATLAAVQRAAVMVCASLPNLIADAGDVAADAVVRLSAGTAAERAALAAVGSGSASALTVVRRTVRRLAKDAVRMNYGIKRDRTVTGEDAVSYRCIGAARDAVLAAVVNGPSGDQTSARTAALEADGATVRPDSDPTRRYIGGRAAVAASFAFTDAVSTVDPVAAARAAAVKSAGKVGEQTSARPPVRGPKESAKPGDKLGSLRLVREASLLTLLSNQIRGPLGHGELGNAVSGGAPESSGLTLASVLAPDGIGPAWLAAWAANVDAYVTDAASPANVREAASALAHLTAADWHTTAQWYRSTAAREAAKAVAARDAVPAKGGPADRRTARKTALGKALAADAVAARASALAALAVGAWAAHRDGRPVTVAALVVLSLSAVDADTHQVTAIRRPDVSTWDRTAVLALMGLPVDANGRAARSLSATVREAAMAAMDDVTADGWAPRTYGPRLSDATAARASAARSAASAARRYARATEAANMAARGALVTTAGAGAPLPSASAARAAREAAREAREAASAARANEAARASARHGAHLARLAVAAGARAASPAPVARDGGGLLTAVGTWRTVTAPPVSDGGYVNAPYTAASIIGRLVATGR